MTLQRELWLKNAASDSPPNLVRRLKRAGGDLRFLIVAEDWCPDSVNTVPYIVRLSLEAGVRVRLVDRVVGQSLLNRHRTPDGRVATPTVVLFARRRRCRRLG